jgi:rhodanese-related sulfurtransferase
MIPSAVNLPLSVLSNSLHLQPDAFKAKHGFEKPKKTQEVIFYCRSGKRSTSASDVAKRNGFTKRVYLNYALRLCAELLKIAASSITLGHGWSGWRRGERKLFN